MRWAAAVAALVILLALTWFGLSGGVHQLTEAHSAGQRAQTYAQLAYGVLSVVLIVTAWRPPSGAKAVVVLWAFCVTLAGGLAPIVWGESGLPSGLAAAVLSLLIALGTLWLLGTGTRARRGGSGAANSGPSA